MTWLFRLRIWPQTSRLGIHSPKPVVQLPKHHAKYSDEITLHPGTLPVRATVLKIRLLSSYSTLLWNPP
jgi:hypothetical protein